MRGRGEAGERGGTLLDSGPVFAFLVSRLSRTLARDPWQEVSWPLSADRAFLRFLGRPGGRPVLLPPGALVEIHHLARSRRRVGSRPSEILQTFWDHAPGELIALGVNEEVVRIAELQVHRLQAFGPVDASLFGLAERWKGAVLVSSDAVLRRAFRVSRLPAVSPEEVFAGAG